MLHSRGLRMVTTVAGALALAGVCPGTALAGGSFGFSFGYSSSPGYVYTTPVVSYAPAVYATPVVTMQPTQILPYTGVRIVQHGDYYAYPTGVIHAASPAYAAAGGVVVTQPAPVVVTPSPVRAGISIYAGGSYGGAWRHATRTVGHYRRGIHRARHTIRRTYIAPVRQPSRHFHRATVGHRLGARRLATPVRSIRSGGHRYRR